MEIAEDVAEGLSAETILPIPFILPVPRSLFGYPAYVLTNDQNRKALFDRQRIRW